MKKSESVEPQSLPGLLVSLEQFSSILAVGNFFLKCEIWPYPKCIATLKCSNQWNTMVIDFDSSKLYENLDFRRICHVFKDFIPYVSEKLTWLVSLNWVVANLRRKLYSPTVHRISSRGNFKYGTVLGSTGRSYCVDCVP